MSTKLERVIQAQNSLYQTCNFKSSPLIAEAESKEYFAHSYEIENKNVRFRIAKKTPTKSGQFVTMWKRMNDGTIGPYDFFDEVDFFVVNVMDERKLGQFVFPKSILIKKNIFSQGGKGGKRGIRIYAPWDKTYSKQADQTKEWQVGYFIDMTPNASVDVEFVRGLYSIEVPYVL